MVAQDRERQISRRICIGGRDRPQVCVVDNKGDKPDQGRDRDIPKGTSARYPRLLFLARCRGRFGRQCPGPYATFQRPYMVAVGGFNGYAHASTELSAAGSNGR